MPATLAELIHHHRDEIVARFVLEVQRKDLPPPGTSGSLLIDHIPGFLDEVLGELSARTGVRFSHDAVDVSPTARRHGEQRWAIGYDFDAVLREYGILRHAIVEVAKQVGAAVTLDDFDVLAKCFNVGVAEAATEYARSRDEQLAIERANLRFLAEAGELLMSSLDYRSTLRGLTRLVIPHLADWCAVHIEGDDPRDVPLAHVNVALVPVLRELFERFPTPHGPVGHRAVARTGGAQLIERVSPEHIANLATSPEHRALLERLGTCSWMSVPLGVQSKMFGAIVFARSESGRSYGPSDLVLAEELARRASVALDNARLYELSQQERERVEEATRTKDELVAMVTHELRTPLHAIVGWTRLLRSGGLSEETRERALEVIERSGSAQNQLVSDLLDISQVITGRIRIHPAEVDLATIVDLAIEDSRVALEAKRLQIFSDLDRAQSTLRGDGARLQQVVWNLLTNAIKFSSKDGEIHVELRRLGSDLQLVVRDTGIGISEAFLPHVFESFRQSNSSHTRGYGGLGIGLSITKHLVELHGGSITAESEGPGKGSTFIVRLPVSPLVSARVRVPRIPTPAPPAEGAPGGLEGLHVLTMDDDPEARELLRAVLERSGIEVTDAASATEALEKIAKTRFDAIVSDIGMPSEDGYLLITSVRALPVHEHATIPAIALTGLTSAEDRQRALAAGFHRFLTKPVELTELLAAVAEVTGRRNF